MHDVIFGGYGFIGNELFKRIKNCKRYSNTRKIAKKNLIAYNEKNFSKIIREAPKNIFYLSGISSPNFRENNHYINLLENIKYQNLLESAKKNKYKGRIFFFSSIAVYGSSKNEAVEKYDNLKPESHYALSKIVGELQSNFYSKNYNLKIINLRLCSIFGPTLKRQVIFKIFKETQNQKKYVKLLGNINDSREFLYIDDLIDILLKIKRKKITSGTYNIGSNYKIKISEIVNHFNKKNKKIKFLNKLKLPNFKKLNIKKVNRLIEIKLPNIYKNLDKYYKILTIKN